MNDRIEPRTLKGFRDYLPEAMMPREHIIDTAKSVYRAYGFAPIDTPALEYAEILIGKGGDESDKQLYRFEDQGGRDVAMRFDLTVPLARFVAQHSGELGMPFKRYHVGPVWRGENTQRGRYREFVQCDFDTIGTESVLADVETGLVIVDLLRALGFERFTVKVNNRRVLTGVLERLGLADRALPVLRVLDKLAKVGPDGVAAELVKAAGTSDQQARAIVELGEIARNPHEVLAALPALVEGSEVGARGVAELGAVVEGMLANGVLASTLDVDVSTARGLDYYTGTVFETYLDALPGIGSVCSGGRYDDLASVYTKQRLPGIGASLGVDRLLAAMDELGLVEHSRTPASVLVTQFDAEHWSEDLGLATQLRAAGLAVEVYPDARKIGAQLKYADRRGHRIVLIVGSRERASGVVQLKDMTKGESRDVPRSDVVAACRAILASG